MVGLYPSPQCPEYRKAFENSEMKRLPFNICFLQQQHENPISRLKTTSQTNKIGHFSAYCQYARNRMNCSLLFFTGDGRTGPQIHFVSFYQCQKGKWYLCFYCLPHKKRERDHKDHHVFMSVSVWTHCVTDTIPNFLPSSVRSKAGIIFNPGLQKIWKLNNFKQTEGKNANTLNKEWLCLDYSGLFVFFFKVNSVHKFPTINILFSNQEEKKLFLKDENART